MFSDDDVRELIQKLPANKDPVKLLPQLVPLPDGSGFSTLQHLEHEFQNQVTRGSERIPISNLAHSLGTDTDTVLQLVKSHPKLSLMSRNLQDVITKSERDAIEQRYVDTLTNRCVSANSFAARLGICGHSYSVVQGALREEVINDHAFLTTNTYKATLTDVISKRLHEALESMSPVDISSESLPGSPPRWFFEIRILYPALDSLKLQDKFEVTRTSRDVMRCVPTSVIQQQYDTTVVDLQSGKLSYLDLNTFQESHGHILQQQGSMRERFESLSGVDVEGSFAVSQKWLSNFVAKSIEKLEQIGYVDLAIDIEQTFPEPLQNHIRSKADQSITADCSTETIRINQIVFAKPTYDSELGKLCEIATASAALQHTTSEKDPKFALAALTPKIPNTPLTVALLSDRTTEKALEASFAAEITRIDSENEASFASFWVERTTRLAIYHAALPTISDPKLRDQLADLLGSYAQKELIPDALAKARSQGLAQSRRTRRNIAKLETVLSTDSDGVLDTADVISALEKFAKKQGLDAPSSVALQDAKDVMLADLVRRLQKTKKGDAPLAFLTLIVVLFARRHEGIVYATGKFAPKLLKQLKGVLDDEQVALLEGWKEGAKSGSLGKEEREAMRRMAEDEAVEGKAVAAEEEAAANEGMESS